LFDLLWSLSETLPAGIYDPNKLTEFVSEGLETLGICDDFHNLPRELYIIATDLDTGERAIFGEGYLDGRISQAVAASSALPLMYKPVRIGGNDYIDGGMRGTASIDLAIERGASLIVCINPLVPFDNNKRDKIPFLGPDGGHLSEKGIQSIANQTIRIMMHSGLHYHVKQLRRTHPEVDIILIEPKPDDYQMFFYNIMRFSTRQLVARHGFESVTLDLAKDYVMFKDALARHGIPISRHLVIEELAEIEKSNYDPQVVQRVLEAKATVCSRRKRGTPLCRLNATLAQLELLINNLEIN
jgi:hypothetical protein